MRQCVLILLAFSIGCHSALKPGTAMVQCPHDAASLPKSVHVPHEGRYELRREGSTPCEIPMATVELERRDEVGFVRQADQRIVAKAGGAEVELPPGTYYWTLAKESEMTGPRLRWYYAKQAGNGILFGTGILLVSGLVLIGGLAIFVIATFKMPSDR